MWRIENDLQRLALLFFFFLCLAEIIYERSGAVRFARAHVVYILQVFL